MKTLALFNNKGAVGKTTLVYHLGFMFAELGHRVVLADLDPQANLSTMCVTDDRLEAIWGQRRRATIYGAIERSEQGVGDVDPIAHESVGGNIALIVGDLQLSEIEDDLAQQWPNCLDGDQRALRVTSALHRVVSDVGRRTGADIAVLDVGPNLDAINRAALIAADHVLVPVAPDLFSMQGLESVGPRLAMWRAGWRERREKAPALDVPLPEGAMHPLGYVVSPRSALSGGAAQAFQRWIDQMPAAYRQSFGEPVEPGAVDVASDAFCLAQLKNYRSLMSMAREARKPMFLLKPADGAMGGHQGAVRLAYDDFRALARRVLERMSVAG